MFDDSFDLDRLYHLWSQVRIERPVSTGLFTFGDSTISYCLVIAPGGDTSTCTVTRGEVEITKPKIITPDSHPELNNFFEEQSEEDSISHILARTANFHNLKLNNVVKNKETTSDSVEEIVDRMNRRFDAEDEDQIAILSAPYGLGGMAILRYSMEKVMESAPDNIQELRERGFIP